MKQALKGMPGPQTPLLLQSRVRCSILCRGWALAKHFLPPPATPPHSTSSSLRPLPSLSPKHSSLQPCTPHPTPSDAYLSTGVAVYSTTNTLSRLKGHCRLALALRRGFQHLWELRSRQQQEPCGLKAGRSPMLGCLSSCRWLMSHRLAMCGLETHIEKVPCGLTRVPGCCPSLTRPPGKKLRGISPAKPCKNCRQGGSLLPQSRLFPATPATPQPGQWPRGCQPTLRLAEQLHRDLSATRCLQRFPEVTPRHPACTASPAPALVAQPRDLD